MYYILYHLIVFFSKRCFFDKAVVKICVAGTSRFCECTVANLQ